MPRCRYCKTKYTPTFNSLSQKSCLDPECLAKHGKYLIEQQSKKWVKDKREELKTTKDWLQLLQAVFNKWTRLRDIAAGHGCISCGQSMIGKKGDASHFFSVGSYPNLRFDERNVHLACVFCNQHKGGNLIEYGLRLPDRIGQEAFEELKSIRSGELKLTLPQIKEMITLYRSKIKALENK